MEIGIPKEIKTLEGRVALTPKAVKELTSRSHHVFIEQKAGLLSGYPDTDYINAGATVVDTAEEVFHHARLVVKVKEPQASELALLRDDHILFSYLHLAAAPGLTGELVKIGLTAVAFETVAEGRKLPLLAPMSDIAGRIAIQVGTHLLHQPQGGRGILLGGGGLANTEKGQVVILGGGIAGTGATHVASALGANVLVFEPNIDKQEQLMAINENITACSPSDEAIDRAVKNADLLIGAVLIPGAKAPHLVSAEQVKSMKAGSVVIDISVDQGGCIETTRPTTYENPTFIWEGVIHFGVTNMPGAVPRTATQALSEALLPYVLEICESDWQANEALASGINVQNGQIILPTLR